MIELKDKIKQLRIEKKWKQADLAKKLSIHQKQISSYERGVNYPTTETLIKLSEIFDVSLDYLVFNSKSVSAKIEIKDRELLKKFEAIDKLNNRDKQLVMEILDLVILKNNFQELLNNKEGIIKAS